MWIPPSLAPYVPVGFIEKFSHFAKQFDTELRITFGFLEQLNGPIVRQEDK
jgi:hypothetical protein